MKAKGNDNLAQVAKALARPMTVAAAYEGLKHVMKNWTEDGSGHIQFQRLQFFEDAILNTRSRSHDEFMLKFKYAKFENDNGGNVFAILESMAKDAIGLVELTAPSKDERPAWQKRFPNQSMHS
jgi:hypothetical protein